MKTLMALVLLAASAANAQTTARTVGPNTYITKPGGPTATVRTVGPNTYITVPNVPPVTCRTVGKTVYCN